MYITYYMHERKCSCVCRWWIASGFPIDSRAQRETDRTSSNPTSTSTKVVPCEDVLHGNLIITDQFLCQSSNPFISSYRSHGTVRCCYIWLGLIIYMIVLATKNIEHHTTPCDLKITSLYTRRFRDFEFSRNVFSILYITVGIIHILSLFV